MILFLLSFALDDKRLTLKDFYLLVLLLILSFFVIST
ncbi:hypothetical protein SAMN05216297_113137 [Flavobacterium phragmitis]|uniref:Uncharacterized protein n=1 Tax=Flavobacterium phragmitis TaxID=739143 RepID=A0A1I1VUF0_9FLAO|nr:hypothetical protein SAMN05216297_113137 [Flavobacterium phragmitis]